MGALSKDDILKPRPWPVERVETPEWGEGSFVYIRLLTGAERDWYEQGRYKVREVGRERKVDFDLSNDTARICCVAMSDADGKRLFGDQDAEAVGRLEGPALGRVGEAAKRLNKLDVQALEDAKKNSEPTPNGESSSSSPEAAERPPPNSSKRRLAPS